MNPKLEEATEAPQGNNSNISNSQKQQQNNAHWIKLPQNKTIRHRKQETILESIKPTNDKNKHKMLKENDAEDHKKRNNNRQHSTR